jgi:quercetin dioxygenase-like cupin family protein
MKNNDDAELTKGEKHILIEIVEYVPGSVVTKTIIKKSTGNISVSSVEEGEEIGTKTLPFDIFVQIIDGSGKLEINKIEQTLKLGEVIIIPAHSFHRFVAEEKFKIITTIIKSGYEEVAR